MKTYLLFHVKFYLVRDEEFEGIQVEDFYGAFSSKDKATAFKRKLEEKVFKGQKGFFMIKECIIDKPEQLMSDSVLLLLK